MLNQSLAGRGILYVLSYAYAQIWRVLLFAFLSLLRVCCSKRIVLFKGRYQFCPFHGYILYKLLSLLRVRVWVANLSIYIQNVIECPPGVPSYSKVMWSIILLVIYRHSGIMWHFYMLSNELGDIIWSLMTNPCTYYTQISSYKLSLII